MDIKVNSSDWDGLSAADQDTIKKIIGANFKDTNVSSADDVSPAEQALKSRTLGFNLSNPFCEAACGVAEAAAVAACAGLTGPAAAACIAAAHEGGNLCRSRC